MTQAKRISGLIIRAWTIWIKAKGKGPIFSKTSNPSFRISPTTPMTRFGKSMRSPIGNGPFPLQAETHTGDTIRIRTPIPNTFTAPTRLPEITHTCIRYTGIAIKTESPWNREGSANGRMAATIAKPSTTKTSEPTGSMSGASPAASKPIPARKALRAPISII